MTLATKPTPAALRRRLEKIERYARELEQLVTRWNPKGKHFSTQRELAAAAPAIAHTANGFRARLTSRPPNWARLSRGLMPRG